MKFLIIFCLIQLLISDDEGVHCLRSRYRLIRTYSNPAPLSGSVVSAGGHTNPQDQPSNSASTLSPSVPTQLNPNVQQSPIQTPLPEVPALRRTSSDAAAVDEPMPLPGNAVPKIDFPSESAPTLKQNAQPFASLPFAAQSQSGQNFAADPFAAAVADGSSNFYQPAWVNPNQWPVRPQPQAISPYQNFYNKRPLSWTAYPSSGPANSGIVQQLFPITNF